MFKDKTLSVFNVRLTSSIETANVSAISHSLSTTMPAFSVKKAFLAVSHADRTEHASNAIKVSTCLLTRLNVLLERAMKKTMRVIVSSAQ